MKLAQIEAELKSLDDMATVGGVSRSYVEVRNGTNEVIIGGNTEGLVLLALQLVRLAQNETPGAHIHIDEASIAGLAETRLVLRRSEVSW